MHITYWSLDLESTFRILRMAGSVLQILILEETEQKTLSQDGPAKCLCIHDLWEIRTQLM